MTTSPRVLGWRVNSNPPGYLIVGAPDGVAALDGTGKVPVDQVPEIPGSDPTALHEANNLSDVANAATALANLGGEPTLALSNNADLTDHLARSGVDWYFAKGRGNGYNDPTGKANVSPVPAGYALDLGAVRGNAGTAPMNQVSGVWTMTNSGSVGSSRAFYSEFGVPAGQHPRHISVEYQAPIDTNASYAVVLPEQPWAPQPGDTYYGVHGAAQSMAGIHFAVNQITGQWICSVYNPPAGSSALRTDDHIVPYTATAITLRVVNGAGTQTTSSLTTLTAAAIQTALQGLANVGAGKVTVRQNWDSTFSALWDVSLGAVTLTISAYVAGTLYTDARTPTVLHYVDGVNAYGSGVTPARNDTDWHRVQFYVDYESSSVLCLFPDGTFASMSHPGIAAYTRETWVLEGFCVNSVVVDAPLSYRRVGWTHERPPNDMPLASKGDAMRFAAAAANAKASTPVGYGVQAGSGQWQQPSNLVSNAGQVLVSGAAFWVPIDIGPLSAGKKITALGISNTIAEVGGTTTHTLGIYADDGSGGFPNLVGGPLAQVNVTPTATGTVSGTVSYRFPPTGGRYWAMYLYVASVAPGTPAKPHGISTGIAIGGGTPATSSRGWTATGLAAPPSTAITLVGAANPIVVAVKHA